MTLGMKRNRRAGRVGVILRLAIIVVLAGCAWYVGMVKDPLNPDRHRAAQFCESIVPEMSPAAIMQAATEKGATDFATPTPGELVVYFGKGACAIGIRTGDVASGSTR